MTEKRKVVCLLSGGMDSSTLLAAFRLGWVVPDGDAETFNVSALTIHYGQRHSREIESAKWIANFYGVDHRIMDISDTFRNFTGQSALVNPQVDVPEGHYADENMKQTIVPNRNMILLSIATGYAVANGADIVAYAAHAGDHAIYPDCRREFIGHLGMAIGLCDWNPPVLFAPFVDIDKTDIAAIGLDLEVPLEKTWTCYKGGAAPCGVCGSCTERDEAFREYGDRDVRKLRSLIPPMPESALVA